MDMKSVLWRNVSNISGWRTKRKLVLFTVDDYGSIRMSSQKTFKTLENNGLKVGKSRYNRFETIESNSDLEQLFDVLTKFIDKKGNHPVFTPIVCVANPDFEKIRATDYREYFYEPFTETLKRYPDHDRVYDLWKQGIEKKIFMPQFHCREHLNIKRWMTDLQKGVKSTLLAFEHGVTGIGPSEAGDVHKDYQAAFDIDLAEDTGNLIKVLSEGLDLFEGLLGYKASFFTPANGLFNHRLCQTLLQHDIYYLNVGKIDKEPLGRSRYKRAFHYLGQRNYLNQTYIVRNALFEPNEPAGFDWVDRCMNDIKIAFRWNKPAIISSHRVNFSGHLVPENRRMSLSKLELLIRSILKKWPDTEFIGMDSLGKMITGIA